MPIMLKRRNGEITPFRNAEFISAYYFIPEGILEKCGAKLKRIPRNPRKLLHSWDAIEVVESDLFRLVIMDAYAFMAWKFMGMREKMEIYSAYDPAWGIAHSAAYWVQELLDEGILPSSQDLLRNGGVDVEFGYVPECEISELLGWIVPQAMERHNLDAVIECAREYRCFEDFDTRASNEKQDFKRQWYHTRTQHPQVSLESLMEDYEEANGTEWQVEDMSVDLENDSVSKVQIEQFLETLPEKDRQILQLRMKGCTLEKVAQLLGYSNHSGVLKRIRKIGQAYEAFTGQSFGFDGRKIV